MILMGGADGGNIHPQFFRFSPWPFTVLLPHHFFQKEVSSWVKVHSGPFPKHHMESAPLLRGKSVIQQLVPFPHLYNEAYDLLQTWSKANFLFIKPCHLWMNRTV